MTLNEQIWLETVVEPLVAKFKQRMYIRFLQYKGFITSSYQQGRFIVQPQEIQDLLAQTSFLAFLQQQWLLLLEDIERQTVQFFFTLVTRLQVIAQELEIEFEILNNKKLMVKDILAIVNKHTAAVENYTIIFPCDIKILGSKYTVNINNLCHTLAMELINMPQECQLQCSIEQNIQFSIELQKIILSIQACIQQHLTDNDNSMDNNQQELEHDRDKFIVWAYNKFSATKIALAQPFVFFDLDHTLFVNPMHQSEHAELDKLPHLSKIYFEHDYCYLIYRKKMEQMFKSLLSQNINIGFITAATYSQITVIPMLERGYNLAPGTLASCIYVNRYQYGDYFTLKAEKIKALQQAKKLPLQAKICLVDDNMLHVQSMFEAGF